MSVVEQLRYVRLGTRDLAGAAEFAQRILGLQLVHRTESEAHFRSDARDHTLVYFAGDPVDQAVGFEVHGGAALDAAAEALAAHGRAVAWGDPEEAARRKVKRFFAFKDRSGNGIEFVQRPMNSGWRYFASRDAGVTGLAALVLRVGEDGADEALWTELLGAHVSDWVGDAAYLRFDEAAHHQLALHPSSRRGVLAVEFAVENVDLLMRNSYFLQAAQVRIVHGPGRRPTSNQLFLTFAGPDDVLFSYVAEGEPVVPGRRPRQFPRVPRSFCNWGSESDIPEFSAERETR